MYEGPAVYLSEGYQHKENVYKRRGNKHAYESTLKERSFKRVFSRFSEKTSLRGVIFINKARFWFSRLIWSFLLLACTVGMIVHLYYLLDQYFAYTIQTKVDLGFSNLHFPAVTICNVNRIRSDRLSQASIRLQQLYSQINTATTGGGAKRRKRFVNNFNSILNNGIYADYDYYGDEDYNYMDDGGSVSNLEDPRIGVMERFTEYYQQHNRSMRLQMGHQLSDMLISCTIGKYRCYYSNFTEFTHDQYGNCYTLQLDDLKVTRPGPVSGLTLILYMDTTQYLSGVNEGFGARIEIHDHNTYPFPEEHGLFLPSSSETQIGLRRVFLKRLDSPYGNCTEDTYTQRYTFKYTRTFCQHLCLHENVYRKCGCYIRNNQELNYRIRNTGTYMHFCNSTTERRCMSSVNRYHLNNKLSCTCENPCRENVFMKTISHRNWPEPSYMSTLVRGVCDNLPTAICNKATSSSTNPEAIYRGLEYVKVNIFYEDLNYETIEEQPVVETAQIFSDIGGVLALWIGLSVLSIFEIFHLFCDLCTYSAYRQDMLEQRTGNRREKLKTNKHVDYSGPYMYTS